MNLQHDCESKGLLQRNMDVGRTIGVLPESTCGVIRSDTIH